MISLLHFPVYLQARIFLDTCIKNIRLFVIAFSKCQSVNMFSVYKILTPYIKELKKKYLKKRKENIPTTVYPS